MSATDTNSQGKNDSMKPTTDDGTLSGSSTVRNAVQKATAVAGHLIEQAGEKVEQAGEAVGEAALNVGVKVEAAGQKLKAAGKKLTQ